ncbi:hypothetical protein [uncultured Aquimarina sp.]|uniref:hypothetical protein n=1 Tax=uncultured Aquimarina sp. TaxID=575652 RepID=UPI002603A52B|nr:hypothetical protein [uncultured Aquimarina sp.]
MKKLIICLFAISMSSCGQEKPNKMTQEISQVYKEVKHKNEAINYQADFYNSDCSFELLINDMMVYSYYDTGGIGTSFPINYKILKPGLQTYTLRLYPQRKQDGTFMDSLVKKTSFKLAISGVRFKEGGIDILDEGFTFNTPTKQGTNDEGAEDVPVFDGHGLPYAEYTGTFEAKVPYTMTGWSESQDLIKEDQDELLKEVITTYKKYGQAIADKDEETLFSMIYTKQKEMAQAIYADSLSVQEDLDVYRKDFSLNEYQSRLLENYKLQFFGNGKVVALIRTDDKYKGEYALHASYRNKNGRKKLLIYNVNLHRPKEGGALEIIR